MGLSKLTLDCLTMLAGGGVDSAGLGGSDTATALSTEPAMSVTTQSPQNNDIKHHIKHSHLSKLLVQTKQR